MSDGGRMSQGDGGHHSDVEAPSIRVSKETPPVAVAFVPPQVHRGSVSSVSSVGMMSTASGEDLPFPGFLPITFGVFTQTSRVRFLCLTMITNPWFERVSMMAILINCITLGMYQPCTDDLCDTYRCKILTKFDDTIFAFFALEMMIKMVAMGVTGKGSYLADSWNRLDCFIVAAGCVEYCLVLESNVNLSAIRTIRVLRPLRAINRIPSMRILVMLLLDTLPMLGNVLLLCFFVFFIFGIVGVQLWKGMLRQRCFLNLPDNVTELSEIANLKEIYYLTAKPKLPITNYYNVTEQEKDYICTLPKDNGMHGCSSLAPLKHKDTGELCRGSVYSSHLDNDSCINWNQYYTECRGGGENPYQGGLSFDDIGHAWVAIFLVISLEGWTDIMYYVQDGHSFWDFIYFVLLIVIGSFFMINLCLVVIATQFSETKKREMERMKLERARFQSSSTLASGSMSDQTSCYAEILKYIAHLWRRLKRRFLSRYRQFRRRRTPERPRHLSLKRKKRKKNIPHISVAADNSPQGGGTIIFPSSNYRTTNTMIKNIESSHVPNISTTPEPLDVNESRFLSTKGSPDASERGGSVTPRRSVILKVPGCIGEANPKVMSASGSPRRRSSVMFSDVILLHGHPGDTRNVCLSEKTTQTEPEEPLDPSLFKDPLTSPKPSFKPKISVGAEVSKKGSLTCGELLALSGALSAALPTHMGVDTTSVHSLYSSLSKGVKHFSAPSLFYSDLAPVMIASCPSESGTSSDSESDYSDDGWSEKEKKKPSSFKRFFTNIRRIIKLMVDHRYFQRGILIAILINTLSMGVEYHNQPEELTYLVEISNIVFSALFGLEMLLKVTAEGPFGYISNGFNVFDGIIVILSMIELYESYGDGTLGPAEAAGQGSSLSVLRTFRLLRILKLVRFLPQLRRQLFVMLRTMDNVAIFFSLLILFIFIFSILGMNLFGCKFCTENEDSSVSCDRKNFDSLLWASITVFQILTQEDWNIVLFNGMEKTSHWASLYFVALMTFGNYVLFNLLVAILVEGFSAEEEKKRSRSSLGTPEEDKKTQNTNEERVKENQLRRKLLLDEPKCNIEKEHQLMQHHSLNKRTDNPSYIGQPPLITHTAATPQGSPHANLEPSRNISYGRTLSPAMAIYCPQQDQNSQRLHRSASARSNYLSPRVSRAPSRVGSIKVSNQTDSLPFQQCRRRMSLSPAGSFRDRDSGGSTSPSPWRRGSRRKRIHSASSNNSRKKLDCQSLMHGSWSDDEDDNTLNNNVPLNNFNNNHLNNRLPSPTCADHSQCNGSMGGAGCLMVPKRSILTQQNSIGLAKSLSPQSSFRSQRSSHRSSSHRLSILGSDYKTTNLELGNKDRPYDTDPFSEKLLHKKIFWFIEPKGCFLDREEYSLYIFSMDNPIRQFCIFLTARKWFDATILTFIGLNCITLAMERPNIPPDSGERLFLSICNDIFTVVFGLEMLVKVIAQSMFYGKEAYFSSGWNIMDGSLVMISLVDFLMSFLDTKSPRIFGILRVFRLLRALRPLRVINRAPGLKLVVQTLLSSLQPIGNIVLICCTFFIIFGILGVQLFKGSFFYCEGPNLLGVKTREDCEMDPRNKWVNRKYNFDNLGQALMALFVLSSKDGWVNIMYTGLDAVGVDKQPIKDYSLWRLLYFISFLLLVGFFVLNMFVGVVVENFHRCREEQEKEEKARRAAKRAKKLEKKRKKMREPPYYRNYSRTRLFIFNMVTSKYFDLAIAAVIGLNVVTMALEYYQMPLKLEYALQIFNYFFTAVFILESAMKMVALGCRRYIKDKWNQLDIFIVILSVVGIVLEEMENEIIPINPTIIRVMRVLRIARVLKLLKMAKGIRALLDTVMQALPQVGNLGLLFFLLFFIFAALGVELFGRLDCDEIHPCQGLGEHAHFRNFGMAFLTLFRVATGDNWNGIMKDTLRDECSYDSDCVKNCCLYPFVAPIFFVIFVLMAQFVLVNVVVAVLMKHLEESHKQMEDEYDIDVEIERQIAQEEEEMAEMQERMSTEKAEKSKNPTNTGTNGLPKDVEAVIHDSANKIPLLPESFTFRGHRGSDPVISHTKGDRHEFIELTPRRTKMVPSINLNGRDSKMSLVPVNELQQISPNLPVKFTLSREPGARPRSAASLRYTKSFSSAYSPYSGQSSPLRPSDKPLDSPSEITLYHQPSTSSKFKNRLTRLLSDDSASGIPSHRSQRQKQIKWSSQRPSSSCRYSNDDSIARSLVTSFEIFGRVDVDSTSCSVGSSEDVSSFSRYPSISGNSPGLKKRKAPLNFFGDSFSKFTPQSSLQDDCDDTIASSNDSFPMEIAPTEDLPLDPSIQPSDASKSAGVPLVYPSTSKSLLKTSSLKHRDSKKGHKVGLSPGSAPQSPSPRKRPRLQSVKLKLTSSSEPYLLLPSHGTDR